MQDQKTATLGTIFSEVLASLAFMFTDEDPADTSAGEIWLETTIGYRGPERGVLCFRCTRDFSTRLAANLLGTDPSEVCDEQSANDAVKEFMNIVCGQFITAAHGTEAVFNLTIPEISELDETPDLAGDGEVEASVVSVDGQLVQLSYLPGE